MIKDYLNNRNVFLIGSLSVFISIIISLISYSALDFSIREAEIEWEKTLKFNEENAEEFPYAVKTQQGNLYAVGNLHSNDELVSNENIEGSYLAIREYKEEYRSHIETYSCNCTTVNGRSQCSTCSRIVWQWEYDGIEYQKVQSLNLLGQEISPSMFNWEGDLFSSRYRHVDTKEGNYYLKTGYQKRSSFSVIYDGVEIEQGFSSTEDGFVIKDIDKNKSEGLKIARIISVIVLIFLGICGASWFIVYNYEENDKFA